MMPNPLVVLGDFAVETIESGEPWHENCYLVSHQPTGEQALIDPGADAGWIEKSILRNGGALKHILLSHAHFDHTLSVAALCRKFQLTCRLHQADTRLLRHAPMYSLRFYGKIMELPQPFAAFEEGTSFSLGPHAIRFLHTPGHTPGSVCYQFDDFAFTGDTLMKKKLGRTDLPGGDAARLTSSANRLVNILTGHTILFPGHGSCWNAAEAREWLSNFDSGGGE